MKTSKLVPLFGGLEYWQRFKSVGNLIGLYRQNEGPAGNNYLTFNGTNTGVTISDAASITDLHDAEFTCDFWVQTSNTAAVQYLINKTTNGTHGWIIHTNTTSGKITGQVNCATTDATHVSTTNVCDGAWHHVTVHFNDAGTRQVAIAIDGVWEGLGVAGVGLIVSDTGIDMSFGHRTGGTVFQLDGLMGWVRISNNDRYNGAGQVDFTPPSRMIIPTVDANTVSLWPMNEGYGTVAGDIGPNNNDGTISSGDWGAYPILKDSSDRGNDGSFTGVKLSDAVGPDTNLVPFYDGVNDLGNIYSSGLNADFDPTKGTAIQWIKFFNLSTITDATVQKGLHVGVNTGNRIIISKEAANFMYFFYVAGGINKIGSVNISSFGTDWFAMSLTWDTLADEVKGFVKPIAGAFSQIGPTLNLLGTWVGALSSTQCCIGAQSSAGSQPFYGWLSITALYDITHDSPTIEYLVTP